MVLALLVGCGADKPESPPAEAVRGLGLGPNTPAGERACVNVTVRDAQNNLVPGASITGVPITYDGISPEVVTAASGTACVSMMRSEGVNEDLDGDGVTGETHQVSLRVVANGMLYAPAGTYSAPTAAVACGGSCVTANVTLGAPLSVALCTISGTVRKAGTLLALPDVVLTARDVSVDANLFASACAAPNNCNATATSGSNGTYQLVVPVRDNLRNLAILASHAEAVSSSQADHFSARTLLNGCPVGNVDLSVEKDLTEFLVTGSIANNSVTWSPNKSVGQIVVMDSIGAVKWEVRAVGGAALVSSPVAYGNVPVGWEQRFPLNGAPAAANSTDVVGVSGFSTSAAAPAIVYPDLPPPRWLPGFPGGQCEDPGPAVQYIHGGNGAYHVFVNYQRHVNSLHYPLGPFQNGTSHHWGMAFDPLFPGQPSPVSGNGTGFSGASSQYSFWVSSGEFQRLDASNLACGAPASWFHASADTNIHPMLGPKIASGGTDRYFAIEQRRPLLMGIYEWVEPGETWESLSDPPPKSDLYEFFGRPGHGASVETYASGGDERIFWPDGSALGEAVREAGKWKATGPVGGWIPGKPTMLPSSILDVQRIAGMAFVAADTSGRLWHLDVQPARAGWVDVSVSGQSSYAAPTEGVDGLVFLSNSNALYTREYHPALGGGIKFVNSWTPHPLGPGVTALRSLPTAALEKFNQPNARRAFLIAQVIQGGGARLDKFYEITYANGALTWYPHQPLPGTCEHSGFELQ